MKALLIFGLKFGADNQALIDLGAKIKALGVDVSFAHWDDDIVEADKIIIGHSFGCHRAWQIATGRHLDYLALIDYVSPKWFPFGFPYYWPKITIPFNIDRADAFTRAWNIVPPSGSILNADGVRYRNFPNIPASHDTIPNAQIVSERIISQIKGML